MPASIHTIYFQISVINFQALCIWMAILVIILIFFTGLKKINVGLIQLQGNSSTSQISEIEWMKNIIAHARFVLQKESLHTIELKDFFLAKNLKKVPIILHI